MPATQDQSSVVVQAAAGGGEAHTFADRSFGCDIRADEVDSSAHVKSITLGCLSPQVQNVGQPPVVARGSASGVQGCRSEASGVETAE